MDKFLNLFDFNAWIVAVLLIFLLLIIIQVYFYLRFYKKSYEFNSTENEVNVVKKPWKVSVVISAENEVMRLSKLLPVILKQNYPDFEVIVINNGSTDETDDLIESLKLEFDNLYSTYLPFSNDKDFGRKKLAYTLGAKAAKGDVLLFTEPYAIPQSSDWISLMVQDLNDEKDITLGVSYIWKDKGFYNRIARYDNLFFTMEYISKAKENKAYTGVYRNVAFKKQLFFDKKGFSSYLSLENSEDVFINQIVNESNTSFCIDPRAFTEAQMDNYPLWMRFKKNYSMAKTFFKNSSTSLFGLEVLSRMLYYGLFLGLFIFSVITFNWGLLIVTMLGFLLRFIVQFIILKKASKFFKQGKFSFSLPFIDFVQPLYCWRFRTRLKKIKGLK